MAFLCPASILPLFLDPLVWHAQVKGSGKKKRREKAAALDRGLNEDRGAFRAGIMRVRL